MGTRIIKCELLCAYSNSVSLLRQKVPKLFVKINMLSPVHNVFRTAVFVLEVVHVSGLVFVFVIRTRS